MIDLTTIMHKN